MENGIANIRTNFKNDKIFFDIERAPMHKAQHAGYIWSDKLIGVHKRPVPVAENDHTCSSFMYIMNRICGLHSGKSHEQKAFENTLQYAILKKSKNNNILRHG